MIKQIQLQTTWTIARMHAQLCPILCDPMDYSSPGSFVLGISQARILQWVALSSPSDRPYPRIKPSSPALAGRFFTTEPFGKTHMDYPDLNLGKYKLISRCK